MIGQDGNPTYTYNEVLRLLPECDEDEVEILAQVVKDDKHEYCLYNLMNMSIFFQARRDYLKIKHS